MAEHIPEDKLKRMARILGPSSAAADCLRDLDRLKSEGRVGFVLQDGNYLAVIVMDEAGRED